MRRIISLITIICMTFSLFVTAPTAYGAEENAFEGITITDIEFFNTNGNRLIYLSRFTDQFNIKVTLAGTLPDGTKAALEPGSFYNNSPSVKNDNVSITKDNTFSFTNIKYTGTGTSVTIKLFTAEEETLITKTVDFLETDSTYEDINPRIIVDSYSFGGDSVTAGGNFRLKFTLKNMNSQDATKAILSVMDSGEAILKSGASNTAGRTIYGKSTVEYSLQFNLPATAQNSTQVLSFALNYSYIDDESGMPTSGDTTFTISVPVKRITRINLSGITPPQYVIAGESGEISFAIINSGYVAGNNATVSLLDDNGRILKSKYIGAIPASTQLDETIEFPASATPEDKKCTVSLTYEDDNLNKTTLTGEVIINVLESKPIKLQQLKYPQQIINGRTANITFDLVNTNKEGYKNIQAVLTDSTGKELCYFFVGELNASSQEKDIPMDPELKETGDNKLTLTVTYETLSGKSLKITENITIKTIESAPIKIQRINMPSEFVKEQPGDILFDIVNSGIEAFYNVEAYLYDSKGKVVTSKYIGAVGERSQIEQTALSIEMTENGTHKLRLQINYETVTGELKSITRDIEVKVTETDETDDGQVKIQRIDVPIDAKTETKISIPFTVTNTRKSDVTAVEAFLYDLGGNETDSIFIGQIAPLTSTDATFTVSFGTVGSRTFKISVQYKDDDKVISTGKTFMIDVADINEKEEEEEEEEKEEPGEIRIQRLENPSQMYLDVKTPVTYVLTNSGKGRAYNVEVFVTDENEVELAREYIGVIPPATSSPEQQVMLKFPEVNTYNLTFNVSYEDYDENLYYAYKPFEQRVMAYRVSIKDVTGYEWMMEGQQAQIEFGVLNSGTQTLLNCTARLIEIVDNTFIDGDMTGGEFIGDGGGEFIDDGAIEIMPEVDGFVSDDKFVNGFHRNTMAISKEIAIAVPNRPGGNSGDSGGDLGGGDIVLAENEVELTSIFIGNIEPGTEKARQRLKPNINGAGQKKYKILFTYENADMEEFSISYDFEAYVEPMYIPEYQEMPTDSEMLPEGEETGDKLETWQIALIIGAAVVTVIIFIVIIVVVIKKKKAKAEEDDDMDFFFTQATMMQNQVNTTDKENQKTDIK